MAASMLFPRRRPRKGAGPAKIAIAFVAGGVNAAGFAPLGWWPLCLLSFAALFAVWQHSGRGGAAAQGFAFGLGMFGAGSSWMYVSLHTYGGMPPSLAGFCIFLLVAAMSLYPALAGFLQALLPRHSLGARAVCIMPGAYAAVEALRAWALSGFPWLTAGYAMLDTPLAGLSMLGGVHLVSLLALMSAGALFMLLLDATRARATLALLPALGWLLGWQVPELPMTRAQGAAFSVALVQNNVPIESKWDEAGKREVIDDYLAASDTQRAVDLVVWPEAAVPGYFADMTPETVGRMRAHRADFIFGVLTRGPRVGFGGERIYFNSIAALGLRETSDTFYHKRHLVPFGEYVPFGGALQPLMEQFNIPMSNFTAWRAPQPPLRAAGVEFAASICYEDAFPGEWRDQVAEAGALINLSEDAWFGNSLAPHQRLQMARFRALESGRPMLRASNNGLSAVIDWRGRVVQIAPQFERAVVTARVQPRAGSTVHTLYGGMAAWIAMALALAFGGLFGRGEEAR
ncbi:MAG: Apolipoprotein N-acyltransferase [Arenicellales bacterium IbO2]|nr:MAG: Apolipoprotein N-acyltransferase [Arenicellales bacterium IbO2]